MKMKWTVVALCLIVLALLVTCRFQDGVALNGVAGMNLIPPPLSETMGAVEEPRIVAELEKTASWRDAGRWWTGSWAMGEGFKYYRPLTSLAWWLQYRAFGPNGLAGFLVVLALSHAAFTLILWGFLRELAGLKIATVATLVFVSNLMLPLLNLAVGDWALYRWIDQPEPWTCFFIVASLWALLRYARDGGRKWFGVSVTLFIVAILFKESAYVTPFLAVALLWYERKPALWRSVAVLFGILVLALIYRTWALQGGGFRFGSNNSWLPRMLSELGGGALVNQLFASNFLPFAIGCALMALAKYKSRKVCIVFGVGALGFYLLAERGGEYFGQAVERLMLIWPLRAALVWIHGFQFFAMLWLFARMTARRDRLQIFAYLWVLAAYLPLLRAPITNHGLYFLAPGWALWLACVTPDIEAALRPHLARIKKPTTVRELETASS